MLKKKKTDRHKTAKTTTITVIKIQLLVGSYAKKTVPVSIVKATF